MIGNQLSKITQNITQVVSADISTYNSPTAVKKLTFSNLKKSLSQYGSFMVSLLCEATGNIPTISATGGYNCVIYSFYFKSGTMLNVLGSFYDRSWGLKSLMNGAAPGLSGLTFNISSKSITAQYFHGSTIDAYFGFDYFASSDGVHVSGGTWTCVAWDN